MEVKFNDQERRLVGRLLTERRALLIETADDTTQPDAERRDASIELSVVESILGKCYAYEMFRQPVGQPSSSGRNEAESFATGISSVGGFRSADEARPLMLSGPLLLLRGHGQPRSPRPARVALREERGGSRSDDPIGKEPTRLPAGRAQVHAIEFVQWLTCSFAQLFAALDLISIRSGAA